MVSGAVSVMFTYDGNTAWAMDQMGDGYRNSPAFDFEYKTNIFFQEDVGDALPVYDQYYQMLKVG